MRRWVSLGGWCGPALMLAKLGVSPVNEALPFDMVRSTFDGLVHITTHGFNRGSGFLPGPISSRPFTMDPVGVWLLFRSPHACFTHVDLNRDDVLGEVRDRMHTWERLLAPRDPNAPEPPSPESRLPITFIRTVVAEDPTEELNLLPAFHAAVRARTRGTVPFRTVMVLHNQGPTTRPLFVFGEESRQHGTSCVVWNLALQRPQEGRAVARVSLLDQCHGGYQEIITSMSKEMKWRSLDATLPTSLEAYADSICAGGVQTASSSVFTPYTSLSRIRGVPAFKGTCTGFGSTLCLAAGKCVYCGSEDGHAVEPTLFDTHKPWSDADVDSLLLAYGLNEGDEVAATEAAALEQDRGAHETYQKLRQLVGVADAESDEATDASALSK